MLFHQSLSHILQNRIKQTHLKEQQRNNSNNSNNAAPETQLQIGDQLEGYTLKEVRISNITNYIH